MAMTQTDGRILRGEQTRRAILRRAADIASAEGLEGLSIGRLATELQISKSGVFTHFGAKEELQLATVRAAVDVFTEHVVKPALTVPRGLRRVRRLMEAWLTYQEEPVFPGGCFLHSAAAEFDARPGRVRDAIAHSQRDWLGFIERCLSQARDLGELHEDADVAQLAFELDALGRIGSSHALLFEDPGYHSRSRRAIRDRLRAAATDPSAVPEP
jgi:AcrR family transcriptional regulator